MRPESRKGPDTENAGSQPPNGPSLVAQCINDARFRRHVEGGGYWKLLEIAWIERLRFYLRGGDW